MERLIPKLACNISCWRRELAIASRSDTNKISVYILDLNWYKWTYCLIGHIQHVGITPNLIVKIGYSLLLTEFDKTIINKIMTSSTAPLNIFKTFTHICMNKVKILKYYILTCFWMKPSYSFDLSHTCAFACKSICLSAYLSIIIFLLHGCRISIVLLYIVYKKNIDRLISFCNWTDESLWYLWRYRTWGVACYL